MAVSVTLREHPDSNSFSVAVAGIEGTSISIVGKPDQP
jgi:hypothetical protein